MWCDVRHAWQHLTSLAVLLLLAEVHIVTFVHRSFVLVADRTMFMRPGSRSAARVRAHHERRL